MGGTWKSNNEVAMFFEFLINILIVYLSFIIIVCTGILIIGAVEDWKELLGRKKG
jgi:hypothetical protein